VFILLDLTKNLLEFRTFSSPYSTLLFLTTPRSWK